MKKDTTTQILSPTIQEALSKAESTFGQVANRYDSVSQDIKLTEKHLGEKDVKSTFVLNFYRIEDEWNGDGDGDGDERFPGWDYELGFETLDWRKDPVSNRYRLMVSKYCITQVDHYEYETCLNNTKPLIECPIEDRLYYHPRLAQFITAFADAIQKYLIEADSETLNIAYNMEPKYKYEEDSGNKIKVGSHPEFSRKLEKTELELKKPKTKISKSIKADS